MNFSTDEDMSSIMKAYSFVTLDELFHLSYSPSPHA